MKFVILAAASTITSSVPYVPEETVYVSKIYSNLPLVLRIVIHYGAH